MRVLHAEHLLPQAQQIRAERIERRGGDGVAVVKGVDRAQRIAARQHMIDPHRAEIFADRPHRAAEDLGDAVPVGGHLEIGSARRSDGPQVQQTHGLDDRRGVQSRLRVGHEGHGGLVQILTEALVIGEHEGLVLQDWSAGRGAKLIPLKRRRGRTRIEVVGGVQGVVAQKLEHRPVRLIRAGLRHDADLAPGLLAVLGAVGVPQDVEFPHRVDAQHLPAGAARRHVVLGRAGELHAVQQKQILLGPVSRHGEHVGGRGIGNADPAGLLPREVHHARIEEREQVVAAAVQRQVLDLLFSHQAGDVPRRGAHRGHFPGHRDLLGDGPDLQADIEVRLLSHHQMDAATDGRLEAILPDRHLVRTDRESKQLIMPRGISRRIANGTGFKIPGRQGGGGYHRAGGVGDDARDGR